MPLETLRGEVALPMWAHSVEDEAPLDALMVKGAI